jgi:hypothetical protein
MIAGIDARDWPISRTDPESYDLVDKDCSTLRGRGDRLDPSFVEWFTYRKQYRMCYANLTKWPHASVSLPPLTDLAEDHPYKVKRAIPDSNKATASTLKAGGTLTDASSTREPPPFSPPSPSSKPSPGRTSSSRPSSLYSQSSGSGVSESTSQSSSSRASLVSRLSKKCASLGTRNKATSPPTRGSAESSQASSIMTRSKWKIRNRCG